MKEESIHVANFIFETMKDYNLPKASTSKQ